jgi:hypothetical protein
MMWFWNTLFALLVWLLFTVVINLYADRAFDDINMNRQVSTTTNTRGWDRCSMLSQ